MEITSTTLLILSIRITFCAFVLAFILAAYRLIKGPSVPDRVVAIDLITNVTMGMIILSMIATNQLVAIDVVGVLALVTFLGTVAFAMHLDKEANHD